MELLVIAVVLAASYLVSLRLHPYTSCGACRGGKHWGSVYTYAFRACRRCGGSGRKLRLGAQLLHRDQ